VGAAVGVVYFRQLEEQRAMLDSLDADLLASLAGVLQM